jgi:hypothetical protein
VTASPAPVAPPGRPALRIAIVAVAALLVIDATPTTCALHESLKEGVDPLLDMTGLWQGSWQLFAPNVDKRNIRVEADVLFSDGTRTVWRSPDWPRLSGGQRFLLFRHQEYYDNIRLDRNKSAWATLAHHIARTVAPPAGGYATVVRVALARTWSDIPAPGPDGALAPPGPYENFNEARVFYTWTPDSPQ